MAEIDDFTGAVTWANKNIKYLSEGAEDVWLSWLDLQRAMKDGTPKDCEDAALNMAFIMRRRMGADMKGNLRFVIGDAPQGRHAWVEYTSPEGQEYIGDWTSGRVFPAWQNMGTYKGQHRYLWGGLGKMWTKEA